MIFVYVGQFRLNHQVKNNDNNNDMEKGLWEEIRPVQIRTKPWNDHILIHRGIHENRHNQQQNTFAVNNMGYFLASFNGQQTSAEISLVTFSCKSS